MKTLAIAALFSAFSPALVSLAQSSSTLSGSDVASARNVGKQIFTNQCAKCHDADAAKKLPDGTTLLTRLAAAKDVKALVSTRTKKMSAEDARGVDLYVEDLVARFRSSQPSR